MTHAARAKDAAGVPSGAAPDQGSAVPRPRGLCVRAAELSAVREDGREVDFICSTESVDSYGEVVRQNWRLERFLRNPVALWAHDSHALPIGQWINVRVEDGALRGTLKVATAAANPQAEHVWQSILEKTLRAVSVGFLPHEVRYEDLDDDGDGETLVLDDNELYEISVVPIPANPDAIVDLKAKAFAGFVERRLLAGKGAIPYEAHPPTDSGKWDASAAVKRLRNWASADGSGSPDHIDWTKYRQAFAWMDPQRTHEFGGFKLPHHDILDGKLVTPKGGVIAAGDALMGSRGGVKIPPGDVASVKAHLAKHYHQFDLKAPWEDDAKAASGASGAAPTNMTSTPARGPKKEARVAKDMDEEAAKKAAKGMITCPNCGEDFDPDDEGDEDDDKSKAAHAVYRHFIKARTAKIAGERDAATSKVAGLESKAAELEKTKSVLEEKTASLQKQLIEAELTPLVGVKFPPAQLQGHVDLAAFYATQADGAAKWKAHLDAIKGAQDLNILGTSPIPADPTPSGVATRAAGDGASELADLVNSEANRTH